MPVEFKSDTIIATYNLLVSRLGSMTSPMLNYSNALCLHDIVKPCLPQCHACCDNLCYILLPVSCFSGGGRSSIWQLCRRWWHRGLSLWQLAVPPVTAGLSSWRPFAFSVSTTINAHSLYFVFCTMASSSISYASLLWHPYRHCFECVSWCVNVTLFGKIKYLTWLDVLPLGEYTGPTAFLFGAETCII